MSQQLAAGRFPAHTELPKTRTGSSHSRTLMVVILLCAWLIAAFIFSLPHREGPTSVQGMDFVAKGKLISRAGTLVLVSLIVFLMLRKETFTRILPCYLGFLGYFCWSIVSISWSPLPEVSAGQVFSFLVLLTLSFGVAQSVRNHVDVKIVLSMINIMLILRSLGMLLLILFVGPYSVSRKSESFIHATEAAETAGPGLVLLIATLALFDLKWFRLVLLPGVLIHLPLLIYAQNRLSLATTILVGTLILLTSGKQKILCGLALVVCLIVPLYLLYDPGLNKFSEKLGSTEEYAMRVEDSGSFEEVLGTFSGRTEMWAAVWEEYQKSPLLGHGFFVTSSVGELDVWGEVRNYTAHNQVLQVLVTTGLIGLGIWGFALLLPFRLLLRKGLNEPQDRALKKLAIYMILWFVIWSLLNSSFSGAMGSIGLVFYLLMGVIIGRFSRSVPSTQS